MPPKANVEGEIVGHAAGVPLEVLAWGDTDTLCRHCVDCGLKTGNFCDKCFAKHRDPAGDYADGQHTPLCSRCEKKHEKCHFCRGLQWAVPFPCG